MSSLRVCLAGLVPLLGMVVALTPACTRRQDEPSPPAPIATSTSASVDPDHDPKTMPQKQAIGAAIGTLAPPVLPGANASVSAAPSGSLSASGSASASASSALPPSASASSSVGAASASSQASLPRETVLVQMIGAWGFSRFDLDDAPTKARWSAVPPDLQQEILKTAPEAWLFIAKDTMVTRLNGVPEKKSTYTVEAESAAFPPGTVVVRTNDEGRKAIRLLDADTMRVEDLDKKGSFVTIFARKKVK